MEQVRLSGKLREGSGKKIAHNLRTVGEIPGTLYGHNEAPVSISVPEHELWLILHNAASEHLILRLDVQDSKIGSVTTLVRDVQHHPVTGDILHIDLQRIAMHEKIKVGVPIELVGTPRGVKEFGGVLDHGMREVMVRTTPADIPERLEIDVTDMDIGSTLHLSDLVQKYQHLEFLDELTNSIAHVSPPKKIEVVVEEVPAAEAVAAEGAEEEAEEQSPKGGEES